MCGSVGTPSHTNQHNSSLSNTNPVGENQATVERLGSSNVSQNLTISDVSPTTISGSVFHIVSSAVVSRIAKSLLECLWLFYLILFIYIVYIYHRARENFLSSSMIYINIEYKINCIYNIYIR